MSSTINWALETECLLYSANFTIWVKIWYSGSWDYSSSCSQRFNIHCQILVVHYVIYKVIPKDLQSHHYLTTGIKGNGINAFFQGMLLILIYLKYFHQAPLILRPILDQYSLLSMRWSAFYCSYVVTAIIFITVLWGEIQEFL